MGQVALFCPQTSRQFLPAATVTERGTSEVIQSVKVAVVGKGGVDWLCFTGEVRCGSYGDLCFDIYGEVRYQGGRLFINIYQGGRV